MSEIIAKTIKSKTIVKKIVVGTPVRKVTSGAFSVDNLDGFDVENKRDFQIFVYDSAAGEYITSDLEFTGGLSKSYDRDSDRLTISLDATGVTAGSYGTDSNFPYFTVDSQGQLSFAGVINLNTRYITEDPSNLFFTDERVMSALDSISTSIRPDTDALYDLGDSNLRFRDLYLSGNTIYIGGLKVQDENTALTVKDSAGNPAPIIFGSLFASDSSRIDDNLSVKDDLLVGGNLITSGSLTIDDSAIVTGVLTAQDSAQFQSNVSIDQTLLVGGNATFNQTVTTNDLNVLDSTNIGGNLSVDGTTLLGGNTTINQTLIVQDLNVLDSASILGSASIGNDLQVFGNVDVAGYLSGPATFVIDPAAVGDDTGTLVIKGNLQVDGVTTTVNSTTLEIADKNIVLAKNALNPIAADGAGITIDAGIASITYDANTDRWVLDKTVYVDGGLNVDDSSSFGANLVVDGNLLVGTNLNVNNDLTAATLTGVYLGFDSDLERQSSVQTIRGYFSASGDLTYDSATGNFTFDVEQVYTKDNFDSDLFLALSTDAVTTTDLTEGDNLYYTRARFDSALGDSLSTQTIRDYFSASGDLSYEPTTGTFFFDVEDVYTQENFDSDFNTSLDAAAIDGIGLAYNTATNTLSIDSAELAAYYSTNDITEGSNLYYTRGRFDSALGDSLSTQTIRDYFSASGDLSYEPTTGTFSIDVEEIYTADNFDSDLDAAVTGGVGINYNTADNTINIDSAELASYFSTDNITEGDNLYYTRARFDSALGDSLSTQTIRDYFSITDAGGDGSFTYEPTTGNYTYTGPSAAETRAHFVGGLNIVYDSSTGVFTLDSDITITGDLTARQFLSSNLLLAPPLAGDYRGERVRLYDFNDTNRVNYAIGVETSAIWMSVDTNLPGQGFKWYGDSVQVARLNAVGDFDLVGDLTAATLTGNYLGFDSDFADKSTSNLTEGSNLYYTKIRVDSDIEQGFNDRSTTDLVEGNNLYYTKVRVDSDVNQGFNDRTTTDLAEGNNLYYTKVRVDSDVNQGFNDRTTDALVEGSTNLYYTSARADSDAKNAISVTDAGGDGSLTYNSGTGEITYTGPSAAEARAHFSVGANGLKYNSSTGVFDIDSTGSIITNTLNVVNNLVVDGNLQVNGTTTTVSTQNLEVTDNMIYLNAGESSGSPTQFIDVGWAANYNDIGSYAHTGVFRDATDGIYKIYQGYIPEPDSDLDIDVNHPSFSFAPLRVASITADTLTGVYQGFDSDLAQKTTDDLTEGSNLYYTTARFDSDFGDNTTSDLTEGSNLYYTKVRVDSDVNQGFEDRSTTDLDEGNNLYYTKVRVDSDVAQGFTDRSTTDLVEGNNLYYTKVRVDSDVAQGFTDRTTDNLVEGSTNLYYTSARADSDAKNAISVVDAGGDGSLSYNATTGEITYTGPSASEVRAHLSAAGDLNYDSATGVFSIDVEDVYSKANFESDLSDASTDLLPEGSTNLYYTKVRVDSDVAQGFTDRTTTDLAEGINLYYTTVRADSDFDVRLATKTTTDLAEGVNLYYTTVRADSDFDARLTTKTTDNLTEGSVNLYYTKTRTDSDIQSYLIGNSYATETYVDSNIAVAVANLVDGAPAVLDTLNELAEALNNDSDFAGTVTAQLALKFDSADFASTFDGRLATKTTDNIAEGSTNLYYDSDAVVTSFNTQFGAKTTTDLVEGTNLYYTQGRVDSDIINTVDSAYVSARVTFVEQDPSALAFAIALG